jgi:hypothetical protein
MPKLSSLMMEIEEGIISLQYPFLRRNPNMIKLIVYSFLNIIYKNPPPTYGFFIHSNCILFYSKVHQFKKRIDRKDKQNRT